MTWRKTNYKSIAKSLPTRLLQIINRMKKTDLKASKAVLRRFLIAYYLADQFNTLESNHFDQDKGWNFSLLAKGLDQISLH